MPAVDLVIRALSEAKATKTMLEVDKTNRNVRDPNAIKTMLEQD